MRAGASFGVVLHGVSAVVAVLKTFDGVVVEVDVGDVATGGQRVRVNREAMILSGDLDAARYQIFDRLVPAVMAERQLVSTTAKRKPHQLMTEAYPKHRDTARELSEIFDHACQRLRVARPV